MGNVISIPTVGPPGAALAGAAASQEKQRSHIRFIRFAQLRSSKGIPFSRVHIGRLERAGRFPKRVRLGANTVAWREDEIDAWSAARSEERSSTS
jgi:prophage regulatory protein